jgi:hypothetical protein
MSAEPTGRQFDLRGAAIQQLVSIITLVLSVKEQ